MDKKTLYNLIDKYQSGKTSVGERTLLEAYYERLQTKGIADLSLEEEQALKEKMYEITLKQMKLADEETTVVRRMFPNVSRARQWRWVAAASVILMLGVGYWMLDVRKGGKTERPKMAAANDVKAPGKNRATITLSNGKVVYLDSTNAGTLAQQGGVNVRKVGDGEIVYEEGNKATRQGGNEGRQGNEATGQGGNEAMVYNTLTNPRGSKVIDMTLSDGSRVWLNAGSSLTYPVAFNDEERKVSIAGEAYFEVTKAPSGSPEGGGKRKKLFIVSKGGVSVTVLGTHFNVNAYDDEGGVKVTLLEGSVKVVNGEWSMVPPSPKGVQGQANAPFVIIKPGEQAVAIDNGKLTIDDAVDLDEVMAWKNGRFNFKDASIETIMRQVEKWYDVQVVYEGKVTDHFVSTIPRTVPVSEVFKILETTGKVKFRIEGNKIVVGK